MQGGENTDSIERELANNINGSASHNDTEAVFTQEEVHLKRIEIGAITKKMKFLDIIDY